jgi:hypothetical protein
LKFQTWIKPICRAIGTAGIVLFPVPTDPCKFRQDSQFLHFRAEMFNMPNHVNMGNPQGSFASSAFGKVTSATSARQIQLGLRYQF